jgi:ATPase subunit of ABC transporter with duplicated ATPase domains
VRLAAANHAKVLIGLEDVTVRRPDGAALFRIGKLELRPGERLLLLGENGVGKSLWWLLRQAVMAGGGHPGEPEQTMGYLTNSGDLPPATRRMGSSGRSARRPAHHRHTGPAPAPPDRRGSRSASCRQATDAAGAARLHRAQPLSLDEPTNHLDIPAER